MSRDRHRWRLWRRPCARSQPCVMTWKRLAAPPGEMGKLLIVILMPSQSRRATYQQSDNCFHIAHGHATDVRVQVSCSTLMLAKHGPKTCLCLYINTPKNFLHPCSGARRRHGMILRLRWQAKGSPCTGQSWQPARPSCARCSSLTGSSRCKAPLSCLVLFQCMQLLVRSLQGCNDADGGPPIVQCVYWPCH